MRNRKYFLTILLFCILSCEKDFLNVVPDNIATIDLAFNKKLADNYVAELFLALSQDALNKSSQGFKKLVADSQTPKGLNMQVLNELKKGKFFTKFTKALDNVNKRVSK